MFSIQFVNQNPIKDEYGTLSLEGEIQIGNFKETFLSNTTYWDRKKYIESWLQALSAVLQGKNTALITNMYSPKTGNFLLWWPMYPETKQVKIQNQILMFADLQIPFAEDKPYTSLTPYRKPKNSDEEAISEWSVTMEEIQEFVRSLNKA